MFSVAAKMRNAEVTETLSVLCVEVLEARGHGKFRWDGAGWVAL